MSKIVPIGAVGVRVRPVTRGFRGETKRGILAELAGFDADVPVNAKVSADTSRARREINRLKQAYEGETLRLRVAVDRGALTKALKDTNDQAESVRKKLSQVAEDLDKLSKRDIIDASSLDKLTKAQERLRGEAAESRKHLEEMSKLRVDKHTGQMVKDLYKVRSLSEQSGTIFGDIVEPFQKGVAELQQLREQIRANNRAMEDGQKLESDKIEKLTKRHDALRDELQGMVDENPQVLKAYDLRARMSEEERQAVERLRTATDNLRIAREQANVVDPQWNLMDRLTDPETGHANLSQNVRRILYSIDEELLRRDDQRDAWQEFWNRRFNAIDTYEARETLRRALHGDLFDKVEWDRIRVDLDDETAERLEAEVKKVRELENMFWRAFDGTARDRAEWLRIRTDADARDLERFEEDLRRHRRRVNQLWESLSGSDTDRAAWQAEQATMTRGELDRVRRHIDRMREAQNVLYEALGGDERADRRWREITSLLSPSDVRRVEEQVRRVRDVQETYLRGIMGDRNAQAQWNRIELDLDDESIRQVKRKMERLRREIDGKTADLQVKLEGALLASAHLAWLTRTRFANIIVRVNAKSLALAEGALKSLAGFNIARSGWDAFERMFVKFDTFVAKAGLLTTAIIGISNAIGWLTATTAAFIGSFTRILNLVLMTPAMFSALTASIVIARAGWEGFSAAAKGDDEALAKLPKHAREAAVAFRGMWEKIQVPVQKRFWEGMGDSFTRLAKEVMPLVAKGLRDTAKHAGEFGRGVNLAMIEVAKSGDLSAMFGNLRQMLDNLAPAAKPFFDALNTIGLRGSEYLPRLGSWLTELAVKFDNFITRADKAGKINEWIESAVTESKNLGRALDGLTRMFYGLYRASVDVAGASTLKGTADAWQAAADVMNREPFKSRMGIILKGAVDGTRQAGIGFRDWAAAMGESATWVMNVERTVGNLLRGGFRRLTDIMTNQTFQRGMTDALLGLDAMIAGLGPAADTFGTIMGQLGSAAGAAFRNLPQLFEAMTGAVERMTRHLGPAFEALSPVLTGHFSRMIEGLGIVLEPVARALADLGQAFVNLGPAGQSAILGAVGFGVALLNVQSILSRIAKSSAFKNMHQNYLLAGGAMGAMATETGRAVRAAEVIPIAFGRGRQGIEKVKISAEAGGKAIGGMGRAFATVGAAGRGIITFLGGPWVVGLGLAGAAIGLFAQQQAKAAEKGRELKETLHEVTGEASALTLKQLREDLEPTIKGFDRLGKAASDTQGFFEKTGVTWDAFISGIAKGGDEAQGMLDMLRRMRAEQAEFDQKTFGSTGAFTYWDGLIEATEFAVAGIDEGMREIIKAMERRPRSLNDLADAFGEIRDNAGDAARQVDAMHQIIQILRGAHIPVDQIRHAIGDTVRNMDDLVTKSGELEGWNLKGVIDETTGAISEQSEAGSAWHRELSTMVEQVQQHSIGVYEQTDSVGEAMQELANGRSAAIQRMMKAGAPEEAAIAAWERYFDMTEKDWEIVLTVYGNDELTDAQKAVELLRSYLSKEFRAKIQLTDAEFQDRLLNVAGNLDSFNNEFAEATVDLDDAEAHRKYTEMMVLIGKIAEEHPQVVADWDDELVRLGVAELERMRDQNWDFEASFDADRTESFERLPEDIQKIFDSGPILGEGIMIPLDADNKASPKIEEVKEKAEGVGMLQPALTMGFIDFASPAIDRVVEKVDEVPPSKDVEMTGQDHVSPVAAFVAQALGWIDPTKQTIFEGVDNTSVTAGMVISSILGVDPFRITTFSGNDRTSGVASGVLSAILSVLTSRNTVFGGSGNTKPFAEAAQRAIANVDQRRDTKLNADGNTKSVAEGARSAVRSIDTNWMTTLRATNAGSTIIGGFISMLNRIPSTITTWLVTKRSNADGNILDGAGALTFASGGMVENHTAQISAGATPYRIWAEPETGGEAYIPLSPAKRERSTAILGEVASRFGYELHQFNDGGIVGGAETATTSSGGTTFNVTNYYPQAEPNSVSNTRLMREYAQPGFGDWS